MAAASVRLFPAESALPPAGPALPITKRKSNSDIPAALSQGSDRISSRPRFGRPRHRTEYEFTHSLTPRYRTRIRFIPARAEPLLLRAADRDSVCTSPFLYIQPRSISGAARSVRVATASRVGIVADKVQPWPWGRGEQPLVLHGPPPGTSWAAASPRNLFRPARAHRDRGSLPCSSSCHFLVAAVRALDGLLDDLSPSLTGVPCLSRPSSLVEFNGH